jgi:hypothetical protein
MTKQNPLSKIRKKLDKYPLNSLTKEEISLYFNYRLENLCNSKNVLTKNELVYLMSETGPGNKRFDPRLLPLLTTSTHFSSRFADEDLLKKKQVVDSFILDNKQTKETQDLIVKTLSHYLKNIKIISRDPFIFEAEFAGVPILCLFKNGGWVLPDTVLFSFLKKAQAEKRFPLVIAKKISGILFPLFKGISILGLNLYKTYLPESGQQTINDAALKIERPFRDLHYNDQFQFLEKEYTDGIRDEYWNGDAIYNFFENILPKHIDVYSRDFFKTKIKIADDFMGTVTQFKKNKGTKGLIKSYQAIETQIQSLKQ